MLRLLYVLYKLKLLSPFGIGRLITAIYKNGINLMTLLDFTAKTYNEKIALVDDQKSLSYQNLFLQTEHLTSALFQKYKLQNGQKVGILCKNHAALVQYIFAVSRLGADVYLLNTEMSRAQLEGILGDKNFDLLIYDSEFSERVEQYPREKIVSDLPVTTVMKLTPPRTSMSKLMLLTGGTTGKSKEVAHKPSLFNYLAPFLGLLNKLKLHTYQTAYIATPIYHGYGLAVLFLFLALGKKVVISQGFRADKACELIREHQVEVVAVVPLIIKRMLEQNPDDLHSLKCIASGSAPLNPKLVDDTLSQLGDVLYNLYGTSEAGLNIIATPQDLRYSSTTLGRKITGVRLKVLDDNKMEVEPGVVGEFCVKNKWSMKNRKSAWVETRDLGYQDKKGYFYLCGRTDDMIVSGGVNVFPIELEQVLRQHPLIKDVAVIGIDDEQFGQRLKAFVSMSGDPSKEELFEWLRPRVARFQMPKEISFMEKLPYTSLGKPDRRQLRSFIE